MQAICSFARLSVLSDSSQKSRFECYHEQEMCYITNYVQDWSILRNLRKPRKFVIIVLTVISRSIWSLNSQFLLSHCHLRQHVKRSRDIHVTDLLYLPTEICWRSQRELRILRKLRKLRKIAIFVRFASERKIVVVFSPGHKWKYVGDKNRTQWSRDRYSYSWVEKMLHPSAAISNAQKSNITVILLLLPGSIFNDSLEWMASHLTT